MPNLDTAVASHRRSGMLRAECGRAGGRLRRLSGGDQSAYRCAPLRCNGPLRTPCSSPRSLSTPRIVDSECLRYRERHMSALQVGFSAWARPCAVRQQFAGILLVIRRRLASMQRESPNHGDRGAHDDDFDLTITVTTAPPYRYS